MAHMDTVFAQGTAAARPFRIEGGRAYGPGVSDDKGGIVAAIAVLKILHDLKFKDYARITLLLNTNEETGSRGTPCLIEKLAKEHDVTLNLESGRARRRHRDLAQGFGAAHHRGEGPRRARRRSPEQGRNAAMELAQPGAAGRQAWQSRASRPPSTSPCCNPATALTSFPTSRSLRRRARAGGEEFDRVEREAVAIARNNKLIPDTEVTATLNRSFPIMPQNAQTDALAELAQRSMASSAGR